MMRHEVLRAFGHPRQITDTQLIDARQRRRDREPGRVSQRPGSLCQADGQIVAEAAWCW